MTTNGGKRPGTIAVVGMALRVPGATTPEQFWRNIVGKVDSLTRTSVDALREAGVPEALLADPRFVPVKPLLSDVEYFDAAFFDITPFEAERTDPAHRLFLECAVEALERAGIAPGPGAPVTGVFGGAGGQSYFDRNLSLRGDDLDDPVVGLPLRLGNALDFLPARVSFKLGLVGPSFAVQAACATSLIAVHLAVQSLRRGECQVALAGGASVEVPHVAGYLAGVDGMLSDSGWLRPFDAGADGTVFGSGVGVVVLRPLEDALAQGNPIHAVILGSAIANDGAPADKASFIAPSATGQTAAVARALADAGVDPETIGYVEAHGTGTRLGDPIEVQALTEVYRRHTARTGFCTLGSVKANVGHLRSAAGVVGLIKACLALAHGTLPPALHFERPNPGIDFSATPFIVGTEARPWSSTSHPRRAAVSAFGFGGSNAHMVLEAAPARPESARTGRRHLLVVSARTDRAVRRRLRDLQAHLDDHPAVSRADVAHTLRSGRQAFAHRAALVVDEEAPVAPFGEDGVASGVAASSDRPVVFLFPGQGAQRPGTGHGLYAAEAVYRETVDHCAAILEPELGLDIRTLLHPVSAEAEAAAHDALRQTRQAQPALFTVAYALARLVMSRGVTPRAMLGHSIGEYVAACLSDTFSLPDALRLVALRGRLMQQCEPGAMLAVFLPAEELRPRLGELEVAAVNAPSVVVVSGPEAAIARFAEELAAEGTGHRRLLTSHAFHSRMMEPVLPEFRLAVARTRRRPPRIPFVSNVTGAWITAGEAVDPDYWARQLRQAVRFSDGIATLAGLGEPLFLELGPGRSLTSLLGQHGKAASAIAALDGRRADAADDEALALLETLGWLWCQGVRVDWPAFDAGRPARKLVLPTYPFQRQRYWLDPARQVPAVAPANSSGEPARAPDAGLGLYRVGWREQAITAPASSVNEGTWLVFEDARGLGEAVTRRLATMGARVVRLRAGDAYEADGPDAMRVRPGSKADLEAVLATPSVGRAGGPLRVLHLWAVTGAEDPHNSVEAFESATLNGFHTLLALVQAASEHGLADALRVVAVADALCALDGEAGPLHAEKAALLGPCRVIPQEVRGLSMRCLDVPVLGPDPAPVWLIDAIVDEACRDDAAPVAALRPKGRYVEELALVPKLPVGRLRLREGGTVLITGGLGGLGLEVARDLFEAGRARIVLLSRWTPPQREAWPARAQEDDKIGQALRKVLALEARGAEILIVTADAGDPDAVAGAIDQARRRFGPLHGVVHAAGVVIDGPALDKTREVADEVFAAKVRGAFILERLLAETPLDVFVHFSSIAAQVPGAGRVDYAAANAVLDALARRPGPACHGLRCAIGWDAWREVGMAARRAARTATRAVTGVSAPPGDPEPAMEALAHPLVHTRSRASDGSVTYRGVLDPERHWVLDEHRFDGRPLLPGSAIVEGVRAAFADLVGRAIGLELSDIAFLQPLFVDAAGRELEIAFTAADGAHRFEVRSWSPGDAGSRTVHASGLAAVCPPRADESSEPPGELPANAPPWKPSRGFAWGPRWRCLEAFEAQEDVTRLRLVLPPEWRDDLAMYGLHPALLDVALAAPAARFYADDSAPVGIDAIRVYRNLPGEVFVHATRRVVGGAHTIDATLRDAEGRTLVEVQGYTKRELGERGLGTARGAARAPFRLHLARPGDLASLALEPASLRAPRPGEVQIEVVAAGLNFRDVLSAMGQLPGAEGGVGELGSECSGLVSAVGEGVEGVQVGDAVVAVASACFATHVTTTADLVAPLPAGLAFTEAAGVPIAFLTADYGLNHLAHLERGERVLIHSASGGVGLAAVQLARAVGAEIFATAGSPDKRQYLRQLGIEHVMDSRSLDFAAEIRERTDGEGVDVVLNALAGDYIGRSLELLRPFGRFVEIGKRDIYADTPLGLSPFRRNLAYFAVDLGVMRARRRPLLAKLLRGLLDRFARHELEPVPTTAVPIEEASRGFEHLARARHIGKVVLTLGNGGPAPARHRAGTLEERFREAYGEGISVARGLETLRRLLSSDETPPHVLVTPRRIAAGRIAPRPSERTSSHARQGLDTAYTAPTGPDEEVLVRLWQEMLGVEPIGIDDDFLALGGNSITAIQILYGVRRAFGVRLPATAVFDNPTVARLAAIIDGELRRRRAGSSDVDFLAKEMAALDEGTTARLLKEVRGQG